MKNCLIAQSGGPTSVINASLVGVLEQNIKKQYFDKIYAGINGIEGILHKRIIDISSLNYEKIQRLKYTPSSALGSCRYKLKDFTVNAEEYKKIFDIFDEMSIDTFFYIGGNDSMDTVHMLSRYAEANNKKVKIMGIPKTIDNDLAVTDHTPGFGSAAKFISTVTLECCCDSSVYTDNGVVIIEAMGRDTGWLAAGASTAAIDGKSAADLIYLPERHFNIERFLEDVHSIYHRQKRAVIVASEGLKDASGKMLTELYTCTAKDNFGHVKLGGVSACLKNLLIDNGITKKARNIELSILQRCSMHCASDRDIEEACMVGKAALDYAAEGYTGKMVAIRRISNDPYASDTFLADASKVANQVKYFPAEWINKTGNHITQEGIEYIRPLMNKEPQLEYLGGLPLFAAI